MSLVAAPPVAVSLSSVEYSVVAFRGVIPAGRTIAIPPLNCPVGHLNDHFYAPHRMVPPGVGVVVAGAVGVTVPELAFAPASGSRSPRPVGTKGTATATNWDQRPHELVIVLHCVVDLDTANDATARRRPGPLRRLGVRCAPWSSASDSTARHHCC